MYMYRIQNSAQTQASPVDHSSRDSTQFTAADHSSRDCTQVTTDPADHPSCHSIQVTADPAEHSFPDSVHDSEETDSVERHDEENNSGTESSEHSSPSENTDSQSSSEFSPLFSTEVNVDSFLCQQRCPLNPSLMTYQIVGDNIDKNVKPKTMTSEHQTRSLHYFHAYAVRDRI